MIKSTYCGACPVKCQNLALNKCVYAKNILCGGCFNQINLYKFKGMLLAYMVAAVGLLNSGSVQAVLYQLLSHCVAFCIIGIFVVYDLPRIGKASESEINK